MNIQMRRVLGGAFLFGLLAHPAFSQTAVVSGNLWGFDVVNRTGVPAHGFELQLEGAVPGDLYYTYDFSRYGKPVVVPYTTGVYVRFKSSYVPGSGYTATTPDGNGGFTWQNCYAGGVGYATSGCEHFAQSLRPTPNVITVTGRWLVDDSANPGNLIAMDPPAAIPFPQWSIAPATTVGAAPVVVATVPAPIPPPPARFGDAQWIKIYKTALGREVTGDELNEGNSSVVPEDATQVEVSWDIVQKAPPGVQRRKNRNNRVVQGTITTDNKSIVRRVEMYAYTGTYDATTHEVICADTVCNAPQTGELGAILSGANSAINATADSLTVTKTGSGASSATVSGNGGVSCGNACAVFTTNGNTLTLTASPSSTIFGGWSGACTGTALTCSVQVNGKTSVSAKFLLQYTLSVGRSNPGTVTATPSGNDRVLDCGGNCSAKFTDQTVVTLTATPPAGKTFVNWSGACSGTSPVCTITVDRNLSVQAVFSK